MSVIDPAIEQAMLDADEAFQASVVRRVTGIDPQPGSSGLLGHTPPVPMTESGEVDEEALYQAYMRRHFPQAAAQSE